MDGISNVEAAVVEVVKQGGPGGSSAAEIIACVERRLLVKGVDVSYALACLVDSGQLILGSDRRLRVPSHAG